MIRKGEGLKLEEPETQERILPSRTCDSQFPCGRWKEPQGERPGTSRLNVHFFHLFALLETSGFCRHTNLVDRKE